MDELLALHKGSFCPPERSQAVWDHTEGCFVVVSLTCPCRTLAGTLRNDHVWVHFPHPNSRPHDWAVNWDPGDNNTVTSSVNQQTGAHLSISLVLICYEWKRLEEVVMFLFRRHFFLTWHTSWVVIRSNMLVIDWFFSPVSLLLSWFWWLVTVLKDSKFCTNGIVRSV